MGSPNTILLKDEKEKQKELGRRLDDFSQFLYESDMTPVPEFRPELQSTAKTLIQSLDTLPMKQTSSTTKKPSPGQHFGFHKSYSGEETKKLDIPSNQPIILLSDLQLHEGMERVEDDDDSDNDEMEEWKKTLTRKQPQVKLLHPIPKHSRKLDGTIDEMVNYHKKYKEKRTEFRRRLSSVVAIEIVKSEYFIPTESTSTVHSSYHVLGGLEISQRLSQMLEKWNHPKELHPLMILQQTLQGKKGKESVSNVRHGSEYMNFDRLEAYFLENVRNIIEKTQAMIRFKKFLIDSVEEMDQILRDVAEMETKEFLTRAGHNLDKVGSDWIDFVIILLGISKSKKFCMQTYLNPIDEVHSKMKSVEEYVNSWKKHCGNPQEFTDSNSIAILTTVFSKCEWGIRTWHDLNEIVFPQNLIGESEQSPSERARKIHVDKSVPPESVSGYYYWQRTFARIYQFFIRSTYFSDAFSGQYPRKQLSSTHENVHRLCYKKTRILKEIMDLDVMKCIFSRDSRLEDLATFCKEELSNLYLDIDWEATGLRSYQDYLEIYLAFFSDYVVHPKCAPIIEVLREIEVDLFRKYPSDFGQDLNDRTITTNVAQRLISEAHPIFGISSTSERSE
jgi:hypothetical protein